jgi:hypothetical protein
MNNLILFLFIIIFTYYLIFTNNKESFFVYSAPKRCDTCNYKSKLDCTTCINCGYCYSEGKEPQCVFGNSDGPSFNNDCIKWQYGDNIISKSTDPYYYPISYYNYKTSSYRHYYGKNTGRRKNHHNNWTYEL